MVCSTAFLPGRSRSSEKMSCALASSVTANCRRSPFKSARSTRNSRTPQVTSAMTTSPWGCWEQEQDRSWDRDSGTSCPPYRRHARLLKKEKRMRKKSLKTETHGMRLSLGDLEGQGGEGEVYRARNVATGEIMAVKLFANKFKTRDTIQRIRYLAKLNIQNESPVLFGPIDTIVNGEVG